VIVLALDAASPEVSLTDTLVTLVTA